MYLQQFQYLRVVIDEGSFTKAAKVLGISQPAITKSMASLEVSLGMVLFERDGRRKAPTAAAIQVALQGELFDSGIAIVKSNYGSRFKLSLPGRRGVHIGISAGAAMMYGPLIAQVWLDAGTLGPVRLVNGDSTELLSRLIRGELEIVIAPLPRASALRDLLAVELFSSTPAIYARRDHPLVRASSLTQLSDVGWVVVGQKGSPGLMVEETYRVRHMKPPRILVECSDYATLLHLVAQSDMMGIVPNDTIVKVLQPTKLKRLQIREGLAKYSVCLFRHRVEAIASRKKLDELVNALLGVAEDKSR